MAGPDTIAVMQETGTTVLAVDAGRTLLLDRDEMLRGRRRGRHRHHGYEPEETVEIA